MLCAPLLKLMQDQQDSVDGQYGVQQGGKCCTPQHVHHACQLSTSIALLTPEPS
jgi:hypothetical protein